MYMIAVPAAERSIIQFIVGSSHNTLMAYAEGSLEQVKLRESGACDLEGVRHGPRGALRVCVDQLNAIIIKITNRRIRMPMIMS